MESGANSIVARTILRSLLRYGGMSHCEIGIRPDQKPLDRRIGGERESTVHELLSKCGEQPLDTAAKCRIVQSGFRDQTAARGDRAPRLGAKWYLARRNLQTKVFDSPFGHPILSIGISMPRRPGNAVESGRSLYLNFSSHPVDCAWPLICGCVLTGPARVFLSPARKLSPCI